MTCCAGRDQIDCKTKLMSTRIMGRILWIVISIHADVWFSSSRKGAIEWARMNKSRLHLAWQRMELYTFKICGLFPNGSTWAQCQLSIEILGELLWTRHFLVLSSIFHADFYDGPGYVRSTWILLLQTIIDCKTLLFLSQCCHDVALRCTLQVK